jgi:hypothetical protein
VTARARGTRKGQRADRAEERALLELLSHGLSEEEIRRVLTCALLALDERGRDRLLARLGEETGGTLRRLLVSHGRSRTKAQPSPGSAEVREEWEKAWDEWEACSGMSEQCCDPRAAGRARRLVSRPASPGVPPPKSVD